MHRIKIITPDPIVETLLTLLAERLPEPEESAVLLDAAWLHRIGEFTGGKVIAFTASADPAYLTAAQEAGADGFWYMQPFADAFACVLAGEPVFPDHAPVVKLGKAMRSLPTAESERLPRRDCGWSILDLMPESSTAISP